MGVRLAIVTPTADVMNVECDEVVVPGKDGEIGLLPGHVPLISVLGPGVLTTFKEGKKTFHALSSGFVEVDKDQVTILTATCEAAEEIDVERAKRGLKTAEERLGKLGPMDPGFGAARQKYGRNSARIDAATRAGRVK